MNPGVLLLVCLLLLYLSAIWFLWSSMPGQNTEATPSTEVPFALREDQTILGVMDKTERMCFCIGEIEEHVHGEDTIK